MTFVGLQPDSVVAACAKCSVYGKGGIISSGREEVVGIGARECCPELTAHLSLQCQVYEAGLGSRTFLQGKVLAACRHSLDWEQLTRCGYRQ